MPIHTVIQEKRRALGLTQEQVAEHLGISAPAVSKWEKGITCPDIGLLSPLARLLKTDVNTLLCFREELTTQETSRFCNELVPAAKESITSAFELTEAKLHAFPHNEELLLNTAILLDSMLLQSGIEETDQSLLDEKIVSWYTRLLQSSDQRIRSSANYMMVSRYIRQEKLELAQSVLDTIEDRQEIMHALPDKLILQVSIYLKQNKADLAAFELEKALYLAANQVQLLLARLIDAELLSGKKDIADTVADRAQQFTELFDQWRYTGFAAQYSLIASEKDADKTLSWLTQMLEALTSPWSLSTSSLFHRIASETKQTDTRHLLSAIIKGLETDPDFAFIRSNPAFMDLLAKYKTT